MPNYYTLVYKSHRVMAVATYANVLVKSIDFLKMSQGQVKGHISATPFLKNLCQLRVYHFIIPLPAWALSLNPSEPFRGMLNLSLLYYVIFFFLRQAGPSRHQRPGGSSSSQQQSLSEIK